MKHPPQPSGPTPLAAPDGGPSKVGGPDFAPCEPWFTQCLIRSARLRRSSLKERAVSSLKERGPCQPPGCDRFCPIPGSVQTNAGKGSGSRLDRRSTRGSGLGLDAGSDRRRIVAPGTMAVQLWVAVFSIVRGGTVWRNGGSGCRSSLRHRRGVAWSGTAAVRRSQSASSTAPPGVGVRPATTARPGRAGTTLTPVGPGNGRVRRAARSRPE